MRRVNIKNGLKQRLNEILGTDYGSEEDSGAFQITPWSIQAAMLSNLERVVAAIASGADYGRPLKGLTMSVDSGLRFAISGGIGFTADGKIVKLNSSILVRASHNKTSGIGIYLKHDLGVLTQSSDAGGKSTGFIGSGTSKEIVYDDYATAQVSGYSQEAIDSIVKQLDSAPSPSDGYVYLGTIYTSSSAITSIVNSATRGIPDPGDSFKILTGDMSYEREIIVLETADLPEGWDMNNVVVVGAKIYNPSSKIASILPVGQVFDVQDDYTSVLVGAYAYLEIVSTDNGPALQINNDGLSQSLLTGKYRIVIQNAP
jgi:hypothetical protein